MKTTEIELTCKLNSDYTFTFTTGNETDEAIHDFCIENEIEETEEILDFDNWEITDLGEVAEYDNLCDFDVLQEIAENDFNYDWDVISAGIECGIDIDNIDEAYQGEYKSDSDFAEETAEQICDIDFRSLNWPLTCIDWEQAAKELMYDYSEANGHYFRNF